MNRKHKDSVFSKLFGNPEALRELYSAIEGVEIPQDAIIDINTLTEVLYMKQINDLSFTIDDRIVILVEHQSKISENVPIRLLQYIGRVYEKILDRNKLYQRKLVKIPTPEFIVLYNGSAPFPDHQELRLTDAFKNTEGLKQTGKEGFPLELVVQVYNINQGRNPQILAKSKTLENYSLFMGKISEYKSELSLEESIKAAIKYCIEHDILRQFLKEYASEVINMLTDELTIEQIVAIRCEEVREEAEEKWETIVADKNAEIARLRKQLEG
ncbi:MAG: Rpn family recombination-promoting nuclease/putative transposase [Treponema sp.]|nr:Rpn family recombination-promoting nuclease/putative transposase [Treponema sp.]